MNIEIVKKLFLKDMKSLSLYIDNNLTPNKIDKKNYAEISTPYKLRKEMLDKIPKDVWCCNSTDLSLKVFEPCCGKGGFLIDIVARFMLYLKNKIPDTEQRYKTIVEEILYFSDINPENILICRTLLDPYNEYNLNYYEGDTLMLDTEKEWGVEKFDVVIGNPPYNSYGYTGSGNTIWQDFTKTSINKFIKDGGFLLFVHPPGWRKPCYDKSQLKGIFKLLCHSNTMVYLSIHSLKEGKETFKCGTKYDWYLVKKFRDDNFETEIKDEKNVVSKCNLKKINWLPNFDIINVVKIISYNFSENLEVIMNSSYHATRDYVKDERNEEYKYALVHSTPKSGVRYKYTNINNKGHFGIPKIIFGESGINCVVVDAKGEYGMTQGAMGIVIKDDKNIENIKRALLSAKFQSLLKSCMWGNFRIDWKLFTYFRHDFWKDFV